jgi:hypothetical protein
MINAFGQFINDVTFVYDKSQIILLQLNLIETFSQIQWKPLNAISGYCYHGLNVIIFQCPNYERLLCKNNRLVISFF